jgi:hypothetical protein
MSVTKYHLGPGRIEGAWYILRHYPNDRGATGKAAYRVDVYVDNGYGVHGYVPVTGTVYLGNSDTVTDSRIDIDAVEELIVEDADALVDDFLYSGEIDKYLPFYLCGVDTMNDQDFELCKYCKIAAAVAV